MGRKRATKSDKEKEKEREALEWLKENAILVESPVSHGIMVKGHECVFYPQDFVWLKNRLIETCQKEGGKYYFKFEPDGQREREE